MLRNALLCCFLTASLFADPELISESMLYQAGRIAKKYALDLATLPPPSPLPDPTKCLSFASAWIEIHLPSVFVPEGKTALQIVGREPYLESLKRLGIQAVRFTGLKQGKERQISLKIDPRLGTFAEWEALAANATKKGISLVGDSIGSATGLGPDFGLALQNVQDYPSLYHLVEIDQANWNLLPEPPKGDLITNIPWLTLQDLYKQGYVPEQFSSYTKETSWNATDQVTGEDGRVRRWIYLKEGRADPTIDWLGSSFSAMRLSSADALHSVYELGEQLLVLDAKIPPNAASTLALWLRKIGAFSVQETQGGFSGLDNVSSDFIVDTVTRPALLHALIAEDAEVLRLIYRLFLQYGLDTRRLVHMLQPFDRFACDWSLWINSSEKKYHYYEEQITGEVLKRLLLKEDLVRLGEPKGEQIPLSTWAGYCIKALHLSDFEEQKDKIAKTHLLLSFFYAMQPGIFSISLSDLLGALPSARSPLDLFGANESTLYPSLPLQLKNGRSFAMGLQKILSVRQERFLESAELIGVPATPHRGLLVLLYRQKGTQFLQLLAINFGRKTAQETIELSQFRQTTAIDLMSGRAESKPIDSPSYLLNLPPLSGKIVLFQPKYYN